MIYIACIVEGHGEVAALPTLLRRLGPWRTPTLAFEAPAPQRVPRDKLIRRVDELERHLRLAAYKCGPDGWILIVLDADDDCPKDLGQNLLAKCQTILPNGPAVSVVLANREFEAWFIAGSESLDGYRGFKSSLADLSIDPDRPRDAKGWLRTRIALGTYDPVSDQPAFTSRIDLAQVHKRSRSFRKLCDEWDRFSARAIVSY